MFKQRAGAANVSLPEQCVCPGKQPLFVHERAGRGAGRGRSLCPTATCGSNPARIREQSAALPAAIPTRTTVPRSKRRLGRRSVRASGSFPRSSSNRAEPPLQRTINGGLARAQGTGAFKAAICPFAASSCVPDRGKLPRKGVGTLALARREPVSAPQRQPCLSPSPAAPQRARQRDARNAPRPASAPRQARGQASRPFRVPFPMPALVRSSPPRPFARPPEPAARAASSSARREVSSRARASALSACCLSFGSSACFCSISAAVAFAASAAAVRAESSSARTEVRSRASASALSACCLSFGSSACFCSICASVAFAASAAAVRAESSSARTEVRSRASASALSACCLNFGSSACFCSICASVAFAASAAAVRAVSSSARREVSSRVRVSALVRSLFECLCLLDLRPRWLRGHRTCVPRRIEFCPERGKFTREVVCLGPLLFERLLLLDLRLRRPAWPSKPRSAPRRVPPGGRQVRAQGCWLCPAPVRAPAFV